MDTDDCEDHDHSTFHHQVILHSVQILWIDTKMVIVLPCTTHYVGWLLVLVNPSFLSPTKLRRCWSPSCWIITVLPAFGGTTNARRLAANCQEFPRKEDCYWKWYWIGEKPRSHETKFLRFVGYFQDQCSYDYENMVVAQPLRRRVITWIKCTWF